MNPTSSSSDIHRGMPVLTAGAELEKAEAAMIMIHGRGASARDILSLAAHFMRPNIAYLAPEAANHTWYPYPFLAPLESNEPALSSALGVIRNLLSQITAAGVPQDRTFLLGFSQGACLALEYAARNATRYAGLIGLSGGLIGPPGTPRTYSGSLEGTPVFVGCSDVDPHIPLARVQETTQTLRQLGGQVTEKIYPGMGHTVNEDEIRHINRLIDALLSMST